MFINQDKGNKKLLSSGGNYEKKIKQYKLKPNITKEDLIDAGFKEGGWQKQFKEPKVSYYTHLWDTVELHIEIETDTMKFNNFDNILVLEEDFCQPYEPFYSDLPIFNYVKIVIEQYNEEMDKLVEKGIFECMHI